MVQTFGLKETQKTYYQRYTNEKSPNGEFRKETDIMDVWFDSGSSWNELIARGDGYHVTYTLKVLTSIVVGLTLPLSFLQQ